LNFLIDNDYIFLRIAGNTALDKDLINTQMNLRSKWKVQKLIVLKIKNMFYLIFFCFKESI